MCAQKPRSLQSLSRAREREGKPSTSGRQNRRDDQISRLEWRNKKRTKKKKGKRGEELTHSSFSWCRLLCGTHVSTYILIRRAREERHLPTHNRQNKTRPGLYIQSTNLLPPLRSIARSPWKKRRKSRQQSESWDGSAWIVFSSHAHTHTHILTWWLAARDMYGYICVCALGDANNSRIGAPPLVIIAARCTTRWGTSADAHFVFFFFSSSSSSSSSSPPSHPPPGCF